jgi:hypothetical protein
LNPHDIFNAVARFACDGLRLPVINRWTSTVCSADGDRSQLGLSLAAGAVVLALLVVYELKRRAPAPSRRRRWDTLD